MTKILIVDDHQVVLEGIRAALAKHTDVEFVGESTDGHDAVRKVENLRPDIVILDIAMPKFNGIEATFQIKKIDPKIKIIVFSMMSIREYLVPLIRAEISGYVMKEQPLSDLYLAIQVVRRGGTYFSEDIQEFLANLGEDLKDEKKDKNIFDLLSLRERQIFQLLAEGHSVKETAEILCVSHKTVEAHKYHIQEKLQIRSMAEWTKEAIRQGIIQV